MVLWGTKSRLCAYDSDTGECDYQQYLIEIGVTLVPIVTSVLLAIVASVLGICGMFVYDCIRKNRKYRSRSKQRSVLYRACLGFFGMSLLALGVFAVVVVTQLNDGVEDFRVAAKGVIEGVADDVVEAVDELEALPWSDHGVDISSLVDQAHDYVDMFMGYVDKANTYAKETQFWVFIGVLVTFSVIVIVTLVGLIFFAWGKKWLLFGFGVFLIVLLLVPSFFTGIAILVEAAGNDLAEEYESQQDSGESAISIGLLECGRGMWEELRATVQDTISSAESYFCSYYEEACDYGVIQCTVPCAIDKTEEIRQDTNYRDVLQCGDPACPSPAQGGMDCSAAPPDAACYDRWVPLQECITGCLSAEARNGSAYIDEAALVAGKYYYIIETVFVPLTECSFVDDFVDETEDPLDEVLVIGWLGLICLSMMVVIAILVTCSFLGYKATKNADKWKQERVKHAQEPAAEADWGKMYPNTVPMIVFPSSPPVVTPMSGVTYSPRPPQDSSDSD